MGIPAGWDANGDKNKRIPNPVRNKVPPLDKPPRCPDALYALMTKCWAIKPEDRPLFQEIHQTLSQLYQQNTAYAIPY